MRIGTRREGDSVVIRISDTGTGQGLAISHTVVVERHGGRLTFETREGVGTTFIVHLQIKHVGSEMLQAEGVLV